MAFQIKTFLLVVIVVYHNFEPHSTKAYPKDEDELEKGESFSKVWEESSNLFYKLAQSVMKKSEFENCTMVLIYDDDINKPHHLSSETELIIQQNSRLRPIIYITWDKMRRVIRQRFSDSPHEFKHSEKCYVVFGEFTQELNIDRLIDGIYRVFLPTAKFIFRSIPQFKQKWPTHPVLISYPLHAQFSWNILEAVVVYNKVNQMRLLLYSFNPHLYPPTPGRRRRRNSTKRGYPVLSAGMGSDGIMITEYQSSLFPIYTKDFLEASYYLIYHPSSLTSVADWESSVSADANHAFQFIKIAAEDLNMTVDKRKIKYAYEIGSKNGDGDWNGYVGQLMTQPNSIGLAFTHYLKYHLDIRVSHPYATFSIGMIYMDATVSDNMSVWVAFSQLVSVSIISKVIIFVFSIGAILCIIELCQKSLFPTLAKNNRKNRDMITWLNKWMDYSWLPVKIFFQQAFKLSHIRLKTALIFIGFWWFSAIYYSTFIKTFLISTMTHAPKPKLITSLEDLMKKDDWRWGTFLKPSVWNEIVGNSSYNKLTQGMEYFDSHASCIEKVSDSKFACIGTSNALKPFIKAKENSHLVYVNTELLPSYLTFAFQKHSPFADIISKILQYIVEGDLSNQHHRRMKPSSLKSMMELEMKHGHYRNEKHDDVLNEKETDEKLKKQNLPFQVKGEDVDLTFKEQLVDSFEELFEDAEVEDIFSFVFLGFVFSFVVFVAEQTYFSIRNARNLIREIR